MLERFFNPVLYRLLLRNQWRTYYRSLKAQQSIFVWIVLGIMGAYVCLILTMLGAYFDHFSFQFFPGKHPVGALNENLLNLFFSLFGFRFLFQKTPRLRIQPYLHLPIERRHLVGFFQISSLFSLHNLYPLFFFVPFWLRFIYNVYPPPIAFFWLGTILACLIISNYANLLIRAILTGYERGFFLILGGMAGVLALDQMTGVHLLNAASSYLMNRLLSGNQLIGYVFVGLACWLFVASYMLLLRRLRNAGTAQHLARRLRKVAFLENRGPIGQLIVLEGRLMWRNRRPRHYTLIALLFSTVYLLFMLTTPDARESLLFGAIVGLFASGGLALNYGQLMFSWESSYFDGLMSRNISARDLVLAKLLILQGSCVVLFLLSLPLFIWLQQALIPLHVAFLFYNAGITSILVMVLALRNRKQIDNTKSGGFFNYEGFSAAHWLWFFPTALPPVLLLLALRQTPQLGLLVLGGLGLVSLAFIPFWGTFFAKGLLEHKHAMAQGFRQNEA